MYDIFVNPDIESSYKETQMGKVLYNAVLESGAKKIIDFGILNGYSTVCMAQAAKQTNGMVYAYDLFDDYEHNRAKLEIVERNLVKYNVSNFVKIQKKSFDEWVVDIKEDFDILHVDVSNTGETIEKLYRTLFQKKEKQFRVFFEGGSANRDEQDWMIKYKKKKINPLLSNIKFRILESSVYEVDGRIMSPSISELIF
tara:strand:+ start:144 stop:737 length:594 start_codon:yes stop_codon:yes gene_type:complete